MPTSTPKSPSVIEVWRQEVSALTSTAGSPQDAPEPPEPPVHQPTPTVSFWKKILRKGSYRSSASKLGSLKVKDEKAANWRAKTEMYGGEEKDCGLKADEDVGVGVGVGRGESSIAISIEDSQRGGLKERRERLERAARLLSSNGKNMKAREEMGD